MKKRLRILILNIAHYLSLADRKILEICFNLQYLLKHRRMPRKTPKKDVEKFRAYLKEHSKCRKSKEKY